VDTGFSQKMWFKIKIETRLTVSIKVKTGKFNHDEGEQYQKIGYNEPFLENYPK